MLNSLLVQDYKNFELIIVDGNSTDKTLDKIKVFENKIKIKILQHNKSGIYAAINDGLEHCKGDLLFILHGDNYLYNKKVFTKAVLSFSKSSLDVLFMSVLMFDKSSNSILRNYNTTYFKNWMLRIGHMPPHSGLFLKKEFADELGSYDEEFKVASDFDYIVRILKNREKKIKFSKEISTYVEAGGVSNNGVKSVILNTIELNKILKKNKIYSNFFLILFRIPFKLFQFFNKNIYE